MELKLLEKTWLTKEIYNLKFQRPETFDFKPGQFLNINIEVNGNIERRAYSISSSPTEKTYIMLTIKREDYSDLSVKKEKSVSIKLSQLNQGDLIEAKGPFGIFTLDEKYDTFYFIAGGTGITPFRSISKYILDKKLDKQITLIYSCRTEGDILFNKELTKLSQENKNFKFIPTTTRDENYKGHKGRINDQFLKEHVKEIKDGIFYICGPKLFVEAVAQIILNIGVEKSRIKIEKWG